MCLEKVYISYNEMAEGLFLTDKVSNVLSFTVRPWLQYFSSCGPDLCWRQCVMIHLPPAGRGKPLNVVPRCRTQSLLLRNPGAQDGVDCQVSGT